MRFAPVSRTPVLAVLSAPGAVVPPCGGVFPPSQAATPIANVSAVTLISLRIPCPLRKRLPATSARTHARPRQKRGLKAPHWTATTIYLRLSHPRPHGRLGQAQILRHGADALPARADAGRRLPQQRITPRP